MTSKSELQDIIDEQCETIERLQRERDGALADRAALIIETRLKVVSTDGLNHVSVIRITRDEHGKWEAREEDDDE